MNKNIRTKDGQSAQSMVEFALVLPILLLVILGIFAFGHLFFVYSSVVSASREAARWGAAVGVAPSSLPRYQDCGEIRAAAVRVGAFAGVNPNTITITYDEGPTTTQYASCPMVGSGPDATIVEGGDRIVVRVTVNYTPIVPLVNLPSFPITAETARTIVKSVPVGDAPIAEEPVDPCLTTTHVTMLPSSPVSSVTGQPVTFSVQVTADDGTTPTGSVEYEDLDGNVSGPIDLVGGKAIFPAIPFQSAGEKLITIAYSSNDTCLTDAVLADHPYTVNPAATTLSISDPNDPSQVGNEVFFNVKVMVTAPGAITDSGPVGETPEITAPGGGVCSPLNDILESLCRFTPTAVNPSISVTVRYPGSDHYLPSEAVELHRVDRKGVTLAFVGSYPAVNVNTPVRFTVQMTLPTGGASTAGETITISAPGAGSCPAVIDSSLRASCSLTPAQASNNLVITAAYGGNSNYDGATTSTTMRVNGVDPTYCPYFDSGVTISNDTLSVDVQNRDVYDMKIKRVTVTWSNPGATANLSEVRFSTGSGVNQVCKNSSDADCVWISANKKPLGSPVDLSSSPPSGTWVSANPGLAKSGRKQLLLDFHTGISSTIDYSLSVEFADNQGHSCTVGPITD